MTVLALALALVIALPLGLYLGHRGKGELFAVGLGNAGRAIPELALIALVAAADRRRRAEPCTVALAVLGIPPILTNAYVGVRQVDRATVDAARGMGMSELGDPPQGRAAAGDPDRDGRHPRRDDRDRRHRDDRAARRRAKPSATSSSTQTSTATTGVLAGAILVALLALALEVRLALLQRRLTSDGLKLKTASLTLVHHTTTRGGHQVRTKTTTSARCSRHCCSRSR